jgi:hypothetical protein
MLEYSWMPRRDPPESGLLGLVCDLWGPWGPVIVWAGLGAGALVMALVILTHRGSARADGLADDAPPKGFRQGNAPNEGNESRAEEDLFYLQITPGYAPGSCVSPFRGGVGVTVTQEGLRLRGRGVEKSVVRFALAAMGLPFPEDNPVSLDTLVPWKSLERIIVEPGGREACLVYRNRSGKRTSLAFLSSDAEAAELFERMGECQTTPIQNGSIRGAVPDWVPGVLFVVALVVVLIVTWTMV